MGQPVIWLNAGPDGGWNWRLYDSVTSGWARTWTEAQAEALEAEAERTSRGQNEASCCAVSALEDET